MTTPIFSGVSYRCDYFFIDLSASRGDGFRPEVYPPAMIICPIGTHESERPQVEIGKCGHELRSSLG